MGNWMSRSIFSARGLQTGPFPAPCTFHLSGPPLGLCQKCTRELAAQLFYRPFLQHCFWWRFSALSLPVAQLLPSNRRGVTSQKNSLGDSLSRRNSLCTVELKKFQKIVPRIREMASCEVLVSQRDFQATCTCHSTTS